MKTLSYVLTAIFLMTITVTAQTPKYLVLGADPTDKYRQPSTDEEVVIIDTDICDSGWTTGTPGKKVSGCYPKNSATIRSKTTKLATAMFVCGNKPSEEHEVTGKVIPTEYLEILVNGIQGERGPEGQQGPEGPAGRNGKDTGYTLQTGMSTATTMATGSAAVCCNTLPTATAVLAGVATPSNVGVDSFIRCMKETNKEKTCRQLSEREAHRSEKTANEAADAIVGDAKGNLAVFREGVGWGGLVSGGVTYQNRGYWGVIPRP